MPAGCLALVFLALVVLLPFFFANAMLAALGKLGLTPGLSIAAVAAIFLGGAINIPVKRIPRDHYVELRPFGVFTLDRFAPPQWIRRRTYTIIAVNLGGCLVPTAIAAYELYRLAHMGGRAIIAGIAGIAINVVVCQRIARPVPDVGIAMPAFMPALVAALSALLLLPEQAPPVAFTAGVLGPLIGADLFHLKEIERTATGVASIGGAGTFDGIVLSGVVAALLA